MVNLEECRIYVQDLMTRFAFPLDAHKTFMDAFEVILDDKTASAWFSCLLQQYEDSEHCAYNQILTDVKAMGKILGIHDYTISLLIYLCMSKKLRCRYLERGIDDEIYFNSLLDLRYKLEECRLVYGVNGSFVAHWFYRFFNLTRFALGRLQFELIQTKAHYIVGGREIAAGSNVINVHIPRTGARLEHSEVLQAYKKAAEFFSSDFDEQPIVFTCCSWLLDPWNLTVLSHSSNLTAFCKDYQIVETGFYDGYGEMWRLFDCVCTNNLAKLPQDSSLRRAYVKRMECGEPVGWGRGLFLYDNGTIIH